MRVKTSEKRREIIDVAAEVFGELGYHRASMSAISSRLGGSKATLYGYFESKEHLFAAVLMSSLEEHGESAFLPVSKPEPDVAKTLKAFGKTYLAFITKPEVIALTKMAMSEGGSREISAAIYKHGPMRGLAELERYLQTVIDRGGIQAICARGAALHLKGLLESGVVEPQLYGVEAHLSVDDAVEAAVDVFLRAYHYKDTNE